MSNPKRALWNVQEPDDPYDIKKSMIAKLPNHPSKPMGPYLELVCLLQAAEIERLADFLAEIRARYRELERRELDRHSYEVQIKELAQRTLSFNVIKSENDRLKDFIRRQTQQLQEAQKTRAQSMTLEALQAKYEGLLNELKVAREQRERSEVAISRLTFEVGEWRGKWERSEVERTALRGQLEGEMRERMAAEVRAGREKAEERAEKLSGEVRQLREWLQGKNQEIQVLSMQRQQLGREVKLLEEKDRNRGSIEESLTEKNRQIQRITLLLNDKSARLDQTTLSLQQVRSENKSFEERYILIERQRQTLILRLRQAEQNAKKNDAFERYEDKIAMMSMQIERLNGLNAGRAREAVQAGAELQRVRGELLRMRQGREEAERLKGSLDGRIALLSQQLERVNGQLTSKNEQFYSLMERVRAAEGSSGQLKGLTAENARLKQEIEAARTENRNDRSITESELSTLKTDIMRLKLESEQVQGSRGEYQRVRLELQRVRGQLQRANGECLVLRRAVQEERGANLRAVGERSGVAEQNRRLLEQNNSLLQGLRRQGEEKRMLTADLLQLKGIIGDMRGSLQMSKEREREFAQLEEENEVLRGRKEQLEESIQKIYGQIDRLHGLLSVKTSEHLRVVKESAQWQQRVRFLQAKISNMASEKDFNEGEINKIRAELEGLTRMGGEAQRELERKNAQFGAERERWEGERLRLERLAGQNEKFVAEHVKERESLERKVVELQRELAQRVPQEEQLRREQDRVRQELRSKEVLILQLQTAVRERQSQFRQGESQSRVWEGRVLEWQGRLKEAERVLLLREQEKEKLVNDMRRANGEAVRSGQQLVRCNQQLLRLRQELSRVRQEEKGKVRREQQVRWKEELQRMTVQTQRLRQQSLRMKERGDGVNQENLRLRMRVDELVSAEKEREKSRGGEEQLRVQLQRAEEAIRLQRGQGDNLRAQLRRLEELITRQTRELETLRESVKEYQLKIVHIESTNSKQLQGELQERDRVLASREAEIRQLQGQIGTLQGQLASLVQRERSSLGNLDHYEEKISMLSVELERLNTTIRERAAEYREKDRLIETLRLEGGGGRREEVQRYRTEGQRYRTEAQRYRIEVANLKTALEELQNINMHTIEERDELFRICHQLQAKLEEGQRGGEEGVRLREEVSQMRQKEQSFLVRIKELEEKTMAYSHEIQGLRVENANLGNTVRELEVMVDEAQQRGEQARARAEEGLRGQLGEYALLAQGKEEEVGLWESKYTGLYSAYEQLYHNYNITKNEYEVTIANVRQYQIKLFKLEEDFSTLSESYQQTRTEAELLRRENGELRARSHEGGQLYEKNLLLSKEIDRLTEINRGYKLQIEQLRLRLTDSVSLSKRIEEHLALFVVLFAEIEALRSRLVNSEHECEQVRRNSLVPLRVDQQGRP